MLFLFQFTPKRKRTATPRALAPTKPSHRGTYHLKPMSVATLMLTSVTTLMPMPVATLMHMPRGMRGRPGEAGETRGIPIIVITMATELLFCYVIYCDNMMLFIFQSNTESDSKGAPLMPKRRLRISAVVATFLNQTLRATRRVLR